jgi:archaellum biogenesis ATPase FlaH
MKRFMVKGFDMENNLIIETQLLKALSIKSAYEEYAQYVDMTRVMPTTKEMLAFYEGWYKKHDTDVNFGDLYTQIASTNKDLPDVEYYRDYVIPAVAQCTAEPIDVVLASLIEKQTAAKISKSMEAGVDIETIRKALDAHEKKVDTKKKIGSTVADADFTVLDKHAGIPWFLPELQKNLLSLTAGQFVVVSADVGTGKSAFVISQLAYTMYHLRRKKLEKSVIYFNSEGTAADVLARMLSCLYRERYLEGFEQIVDKIDEIRPLFAKDYEKQGLKVIQMGEIGGLRELSSIVKSENPALVIIDIADELAKEESPTELKKLYGNLRTLSGLTCPIIATSQAGCTEFYDQEKKEVKTTKWLSASKTYGSRTGKGGAADCMLMIGKDGENSPLRYIAVTKKKRGNACKIVCELDEKFSLYRELAM